MLCREQGLPLEGMPLFGIFLNKLYIHNYIFVIFLGRGQVRLSYLISFPGVPGAADFDKQQYGEEVITIIA